MLERNFSRSLYHFECPRAQSDRALNHYDRAGDFLEGDGRFSMRSMGLNNGDAVRTRFTIRVSSTEADNSAALKPAAVMLPTARQSATSEINVG